MYPVFRNISVREFLALVAAELAIPEEELCEDGFLQAAKAALDEPASRVQDAQGIRGRERHGTMPLRYAALVGALLHHPPLPGYAARVAKAAGDELLARGGARWMHDSARTVLLYEQWARNPNEISKKFLADGVGTLGGRRAPSSQTEALFSAGRVQTVAIYLAGPLHALQEAKMLPLIEKVHDDCEHALIELSRQFAGSVRFRLIHPSYDDLQPEDETMWDWDLGLLEDHAHALVVADLERFAISFGVACEIGRFRQLPGSLAHFRNTDGASQSSYYDGLVQEVGMEQVPCASPTEIPQKLVTWVSENLAVLLDHGRRRDDAAMLATPRHRQLVHAWQGMSRGRRAAVRDAADISPARMRRVLESPAAFAALPHHAADRLIQLLNRDPIRTPRRAEVNLDNLLSAAADGHWPADEIAKVVDASRQSSATLRVAATRPDQSVRFYEGVHRELFGR